MSQRRGIDKVDAAFLALLVLSFPAALALHLKGGSPTATFVASCLAVLPLARLIGESTEALAHKLGSGIGGLLNATFGNAAELILGFAMVRSGQTNVVKASLTGSIIANLLLVMGLAMLVGGWGRRKQSFNSTAAMAGFGMMFLALAGLAMPDLYHASLGAPAEKHLLSFSVATSAIMLVMYALSLVFAMKTHPHLYTDEPALGEEVRWSTRAAFVILVLATAGTAVAAELLVHSVEAASHRLGFSDTFVGVIVIAIVGNAAEHATAVLMASKDRMNLAFNVVIESSKQVALLVAPVLVLLSLRFGPTPLTLEFSHLEVAGMGLGIAGLTLIGLDGESNWLEGAMLLALYAMLGTMFFFIP